jgi:hypothetical protein
VPYGYESLSAYAYASNEPIDRVDAVGAWSTTVHTQMLKTYFDTRSHDDPVIAITSGAAAAGSTSVDGAEGSFLSHPIAQTAKFARAQNSWGGAHEHSMRDVGRSQAEMEVLRSTFVKEEAALARSEFDAVRAAWSLTGTEESKAALTGHLRSGYYHLGRMLHPIMDSTSPAHSDSTGSARVWAPHAPGAAQHLWGEGLDNLTPENMQETLRRMDATLEGEMKGYEAFWQGGPGKFSNQ